MGWFAVLLFTFLLHLKEIKGERYDVDDGAGIASIILLALAVIVCFFAMIFFFYIVYKLWNGNFGRRGYYSHRQSVRHDKFALYEQVDGRQATTKPVLSYRNEVAAEEAREIEMRRNEVPVAEEAVVIDETVMEKTVVEEGLKSEEVIVIQETPTQQAEVETQELVVVFDDNDDVVDVLTHTT